MVVLPVPGGPHRIIEARRLASAMRRIGPSGPSRVDHGPRPRPAAGGAAGRRAVTAPGASKPCGFEEIGHGRACSKSARPALGLLAVRPGAADSRPPKQSPAAAARRARRRTAAAPATSCLCRRDRSPCRAASGGWSRRWSSPAHGRSPGMTRARGRRSRSSRSSAARLSGVRWAELAALADIFGLAPPGADDFLVLLPGETRGKGVAAGSAAVKASSPLCCSASCCSPRRTLRPRGSVSTVSASPSWASNRPT